MSLQHAGELSSEAATGTAVASVAGPWQVTLCRPLQETRGHSALHPAAEMTGLRQLADELLDNNERFQQFVMISFDDEADANQQLPRERCLKALVAVYELIAAGASRRKPRPVAALSQADTSAVPSASTRRATPNHKVCTLTQDATAHLR